MRRDEATEAQVQAARPDASTWLSANAGSGKTRVLTDRVARLLLNGVLPQQILCLTYTKAAASEMQNRLFQRLGAWAMLPEADLRRALVRLGEDGDLGPDRLARARTLFARAIETPGGLKIQTIHSFCAALLRRFPLEAGVSPQFTEMEDRTATLLRQDILEEMARGPDRAVVAAMADHLTDGDFDALTAEIARRRESFGNRLGLAEARQLLGVPEGMDESALEAQVFPGDEPAFLREVAEISANGSPNDVKLAAKLRDSLACDLSVLPALESAFLTGASAKEPFSAKIGSVPTKGTRGKMAPALLDRLERFMLRVEAARDTRLALAAARKTADLHRFAQVFLPLYAARKQARGWLDFDDLILHARQLLSDPAVAAWVLFRLDGGIDHILVDEAQDTSPAQWDVIRKLAQEFTAGQGARADVTRTIFVVGDKKQSIYSFQGADPGGFDRMQEEFGSGLDAVGDRLWDRQLAFSFRSAGAILRTVDACFRGRERAGFSDAAHRAFKSDKPGRVDLWPMIEKSDAPEDGPWYEPVDRPGAHHHAVQLADRIAGQIAAMIGTPLPSDDGQSARPITAGDILILVQRRSLLFHEIIRACKQENLPVAGADRLKVGAEIAVRDLIALLSFLATPEDSLSLASVLKSPLFGWSEDDLYRLAQPRTGDHLWPELRRNRDVYPEVMGVLDDLRRQADYLRPYDLIERVLTRHEGRKRLIARLGDEAEDGIDALLSQALAYERSDVPSLTGFLEWAVADDLEIKRQMEGAGDKLRVMTVHGAKGLEAPVVILPDSAKRVDQMRDRVLSIDGTPVWSGSVPEMPAALLTAREARMAADRDERDRLLYVAMTRAESWLIVAGAGERQKDEEDWYTRVESALGHAGALPTVFPFGPGLRLEEGAWDALPLQEPEPDPRPAADLPDLFHRPVPLAVPAPDPLSPSDLGGAKALAGAGGLDEDAAKRRGTMVHLLLEGLPGTDPSGWPDRAALLLAGCDPDPEEQAACLDEAQAVLGNPAHAHLFADTALAEVAVTAMLGERPIMGTIDRLIASTDRVLAVDFKTNAVVPDDPESCPEGILRQMGAYAHALSQIYPDRDIATAILWTRTNRLMPLPPRLVHESLQRAGLA